VYEFVYPMYHLAIVVDEPLFSILLARHSP
jgi:hypothetical protein